MPTERRMNPSEMPRAARVSGGTATAPRAMTRTKRAPDVRRAQFLDCAQALFFTAGYSAPELGW